MPEVEVWIGAAPRYHGHDRATPWMKAHRVKPPVNPYVSVRLTFGVAAVAGLWILLALFDFRGLGAVWAVGAVMFSLYALTMWIARYGLP
jgi:hypothetical protein